MGKESAAPTREMLDGRPLDWVAAEERRRVVLARDAGPLARVRRAVEAIMVKGCAGAVGEEKRESACPLSVRLP